MKRKAYFILTGLFLLTLQLKAQAPEAFNYQGVARNSSGAVLPNQAIGLRFTIHQGSTSGTSVYQETQAPTTNQFGLFAVAVGEGTVVSGSFSGISWGASSYYLQVEMDPTGGTNYSDVGTTQFLSVPYALYAASAGTSGTLTATAPLSIAASDISITGNSGGILCGTGLGTPAVFTSAGTEGQVLESNGTAVPTWVTLSSVGSGWALTGNAGTTAGSNFIGTTDSKDFVTKTNNVERMRVLAAGDVGIGTSTPAQELEVAGTGNTVRIDGLTSGGVYNSNASSSSNLVYVNKATGDIYSLPNGATGDVLTLTGGVPAWSAAGSSSGWALTGNSGTTAGTNFIGTTDNTDFVTKTDNVERVRITKAGNVGVATAVPAADAGVAIKGLHIETQTGTTAPTISVNPINIGIGGSGTFNANGGTDVAGSINITTGGAASSLGQIITVNFGTAYTTAPVVVLSPTDALTATSGIDPYVTSTTTGFDINFGNSPLNSTSYNFNYFVIEAK